MANKTKTQTLLPVETITNKYGYGALSYEEELVQKMREIGDHLSRSKSWLSQFEGPSSSLQTH